MSDFAWIAFIIILYLVVIKPMFKGAVGNPNSKSKGNTIIKKQPEPKNKSADSNNDDYVDYEELK